jgi:hypothetical protein
MVKLVVLLDSEAAQQGGRVILSIGEEGLQASTDLLEKTTSAYICVLLAQ